MERLQEFKSALEQKKRLKKVVKRYNSWLKKNNPYFDFDLTEFKVTNLNTQLKEPLQTSLEQTANGWNQQVYSYYTFDSTYEHQQVFQQLQRYLQFQPLKHIPTDEFIPTLVRSIHQLTKLEVPKQSVTKLQPLKDLIHLEELYLSCNDIEDWTGIESCQQLRVLHMVETGATSLSFLETLKKLEVLYAGKNNIDRSTLPIKPRILKL